MGYKTYSEFSTKKTPQSEPIPGSGQVANSAGGYSFPVDDWTRLDRFLVLGTEGGTYYINQPTLTKQNAQAVMRCIKEDGERVVEKVKEISHEGRAPKNDPALFVLAMCASADDEETRVAAFDALPAVARIGTHLFHFAIYVNQFRGWGGGLRRAIARWYKRPPEQLAYQAIKYQQRDGWSHRDLLRKSHPVPLNATYQGIYHWITQGWTDENYNAAGVLVAQDKAQPALQTIWAHEAAKRVPDVEAICNLIEKYRLPRESIPTAFLNDQAVWDALLKDMPMTAMLRNLGKMTSIGLLSAGNPAAMPRIAKVVEQLTNPEAIKRSRLHPLSVLVALKTYASGSGFRGSLRWNPTADIVDALDEAFYLSFGNVHPTHKRIMLALDVSSSMKRPDISGMPGISPRIGSAAMALVTKRVEPMANFVAFASKGTGLWTPPPDSRLNRYVTGGIAPLSISPRQRLDDVCKVMADMPFGGTDCALPMMYALENGFEIDTFCIFTDSETWAGGIHPVQALQTYRDKTGINAKLVVVGMVSNGFSIADPNDGGMLDVVGFDTAAPNIISDFILH